MTSLQPNSLKTWRQAPQGKHGEVFGLKTATSSICLSAVAIIATALRSAQIESPYEAFSTFAPEYMVPPPVRTAAPTWKALYGAYAPFAATRAASITAPGSKAPPFIRVERLPS